MTADTRPDYTPGGIRIEGTYENDRNAKASDLFKAIIRTAFPEVHDVIVAHHLVYVRVERRDGFDYQVVEEIPSADALIFDHAIARKIWEENWFNNLQRLAVEPVETRDDLLQQLWNRRNERLEQRRRAE